MLSPGPTHGHSGWDITSDPLHLLDSVASVPLPDGPINTHFAQSQAMSKCSRRATTSRATSSMDRS